MSDDSVIQADLLGVPLDLGGEALGVDIGPQAFRYQNLLPKLEHAGFKIEDLGDVTPQDRANLEPGNPRLQYLEEIVRVNQTVAEKINTSVEAGRKAIVLGGDHSINLGAVSGASAAVNRQIGMVYLDAHGDMNTDESTLTGNIHGMHVASLMGFGAPELKNLYGENIKLPKENLLHIGGSDFDQAELDLVKNENLQTFMLFDMLSRGLAPLLEMIDDLAARVPNIWVSLDLDVIDKVYAPGAGMPNSKGLTYREIATIADYVGKKCNVIGVDVVEYNPLQDIDNKTAELGIELIANFLGKQYSWYTTDYLDKNKLS